MKSCAGAPVERDAPRREHCQDLWRKQDRGFCLLNATGEKISLTTGVCFNTWDALLRAGCSSRRGAELKSQGLDSPTTQGATQGLLKGYPRATQVQGGERFAPKVPCHVVVVAVKARGHLQVSLVPSCPSRATQSWIPSPTSRHLLEIPKRS